MELIFGTGLLLGLFTRVSAAVAALMLFTIGLALLAAGDLFPRHHVLVFFPLAIILWHAGPDRLTLDDIFRQRKTKPEN